MSENLKSLTRQIKMGEAEAEQVAHVALSATVSARRRMLLASLGKGSAVVAAVAVPMQSWAAIGTLSVNSVDGKRCTISGTMSSVHSKETITATCAGRKPSSYRTGAWPGGVMKNAKFNVVFTTSSVTDTLLSIIQTEPPPDNAYWIAAYLNANAGSPVSNFPYTADQVVGLFQTNPVNALSFFKTYMSTLPL